MITKYSTFSTAIVSCLVIAALSGCAIATTHAEADATATATKTPAATENVKGTEWDTSVPSAVSSLDDAAAQATLVLKGTAGGSRVEYIGDTPFTVTSVAVDEVIAGSSAPATVEVRQFGDEHNTSHDLAALLDKGKQYLLYLEPFELEPGHPLSQYVIVGGTASWVHAADSDGNFSLDASESELPKKVDENDVSASTE